jgi:hypothetical protein
LSFPVVNPVAGLVASSAAENIGVIPNRGALKTDGVLENMDHGIVEDALPADVQRGRREEGMDFRPEEDLIGINISDSCDKGLVCEKGFDAFFSFQEKGPELITVQIKGFGSDASEPVGLSNKSSFPAAHVSEFSHIPEAQVKGMSFESENKMGVFVGGGIGGNK